MIRPTIAALSALILAACAQAGGQGDPNDPYAGLDAQFVAWRADLEQAHSTCAAKVEGKGCDTFQITCKAAQEIAAEEAAEGVDAKVVAAMTFNGRTEDGGSGKPGSAFAAFSKTGGQWSRAEHEPVNLASCAPFLAG